MLRQNLLLLRGAYTPFVARCWLCHLLYGWKFAPNFATYPRPFEYVKAMLFAASADELSYPERHYIVGLVELFANEGLCQSKGYYEDKISFHELITFIEQAPPKHLKIEGPKSFSGGAMRSPLLAKVLLYDAVRASTADGVYDVREQEHVAAVGKQLSLSRDVVERIELLAKKEAVIAEHKRSLLLGTHANGKQAAVGEGLVEKLDRLEKKYMCQEANERGMMNSRQSSEVSEATAMAAESNTSKKPSVQ